MRPAALLLALALTAGACSNTTEVAVEDTASAKNVQLDEPFRLQQGERALLVDDDVTVRFDSVTRDSRCPADVDCIRAGEAYAHFTLLDAERNAIPFTLEIEGFVTEVQDMERYGFQQVDRFSVALLLLQPYPGLADEEGMPTTATLEMRHTLR